MTAKRIKAIGKLLFLFGTPLAIVVGLFSLGVYYGAEHRHTIASFERDWLGLDVEVPDPPEETAQGEDVAPDEAPAPDTGKGDDVRTADPPSEPRPQDEGSAETPEPVPDDPESPDAVDVEPTLPPEPQAEVPVLGGDLAQRLALPVTVQVKVLVDPELIEQQPAWIDHVQRTLSRASQVYQEQFGISLELAAVGKWPVATAGMDVDELLQDISNRPREGADILLGLTNRPQEGSTTGRGETPAADDPFNGAYGVVYAVPQQDNPHLRTLLHEVSHMFGALDVTEPSDAAWQAASWMSYAPVRPTQTPWIDAENRRRVLDRKDKPFRPEPEDD
jgi:hypothetical protein